MTEGWLDTASPRTDTGEDTDPEDDDAAPASEWAGVYPGAVKLFIGAAGIVLESVTVTPKADTTGIVESD